MAATTTQRTHIEDAPIAAVECASCPYFRETPQPKIIEAARGTCLRVPFGIAKMASEWCGEHPDLVMRRVKTLAPLFATALADALAARSAVRR